MHTNTYTKTFTHTYMCVLWTLQGLSFLYGLVGTSELQSYSFKIYIIIRASRKKMNEQMLQKLSLL